MSDNRNALPVLAEELERLELIVKDMICDSYRGKLSKVKRIITELAKVKVEAIKENSSMVGGAFINLMAECCAIAEEKENNSQDDKKTR